MPRVKTRASAEMTNRLSDTIRHKLEQVVPYYPWQGPRNYHGRVQYLMSLLEETIRVLAVTARSLTAAVKMDEASNRALGRVADSIFHLGHSAADVCGVWAAETLLSVWAPKEEGIQPYPDSEEERPSPSTFIRGHPRPRARQISAGTSTGVAAQVSNAADDKFVKPGNGAGRSK